MLAKKGTGRAFWTSLAMQEKGNALHIIVEKDETEFFSLAQNQKAPS